MFRTENNIYYLELTETHLSVLENVFDFCNKVLNKNTFCQAFECANFLKKSKNISDGEWNKFILQMNSVINDVFYQNKFETRIRNLREFIDNKKNLFLNGAEVHDVATFCDIYSRIGIGQFFEVSRLFSPNINITALRKVCENINLLLFNSVGGGLSIYNEELPTAFYDAALIHGAIRFRLAWDRNPVGDITVDYDNFRWKRSKDSCIVVVTKEHKLERI
jgi:hypothetical protein